MRWLVGMCALLLIANAMVLLWPNSTRTAAHVYPPKSDINPHFVRLNKEIEDQYLAAQLTTAIESKNGSSGVTDQSCYRLGPFLHRANFELAQAAFFNANVPFQKTTRASNEASMFRVYLGPYDAQAEAVDMRVELKRKKVLDHFVRRDSDDKYVISLGIYTTQESAVRAVELFDGKLDSVKLKQERVVLPESYWMHFTIDEGDQIKPQLAHMNWGEPSAKIGRHQCQTV